MSIKDIYKYRLKNAFITKYFFNEIKYTCFEIIIAIFILLIDTNAKWLLSVYCVLDSDKNCNYWPTYLAQIEQYLSNKYLDISRKCGLM